MQYVFFEVGLYKGEMDFSVAVLIGNLSYEDMRKFREMVVVGIGVCEQMWRSEQERKNSPQQVMNKDTKADAAGGKG